MERIVEILVVDDRQKSADSLVSYLTANEPDWKIDTANGTESAITMIQDRGKLGAFYSAIVTDLQMEGKDEAGVDLIKEIQGIDPLAISILYSSHKDLLEKIDPAGLGAFDIVPPGERSGARILERLQTAVRYRALSHRSEALRRYFDRRLFEAMEKQPSRLAPRSSDLTVVFWDVRGFSDICDQLRAFPDLVAGFLSELCDVSANLVFNCGGVLDKFIGDGIMALFGVFANTDEEQKQGVLDSVIAASLLRAEFEVLVGRWIGPWRLRGLEKGAVSLGCGIHWGRVVVGNLGTNSRDHYTAVGSNVNFAQRLEGLAAKESVDGIPADILISQAVQQHLAGAIPVHSLGTRDIKGLGQKSVYFIDPKETLASPVVAARRAVLDPRPALAARPSSVKPKSA